MKHLACVVGARPNFMKIAPILRALDAHPSVRTCLVHTGQHYDSSLSDVFFEELEIRPPDVSLDVGSGKHGEQTARIIERFEEFLETAPQNAGRFTRVVVVGDVNSTMGASIAAAKLGIPIAHVEAGLRSFDRSMPEEINRIVTDSLSDLLFASEPAGVENLCREGHAPDRIHLVGNVMIDTMRRLLPKAQSRAIVRELELAPGEYGVVTLHRPGNVDFPATLSSLMDVLSEVSETIPLVFPVHPRTRQRLMDGGLLEKLEAARNLHLLPPVGYLDCLALTSRAKVIVTDSGGLQEESTALGVPCLTMRPNTERPVTIDTGTGTLIGNSAEMLMSRLQDVLLGNYKQGVCPEIWDGRAAERIASVLANGSP